MTAYNPNARGTFVKTDPKSGYFSCQVDIPDSWVPAGKIPAFDSGIFQNNRVTFTVTNVSFPTSDPGTPNFRTYSFQGQSVQVSSITASVTVVVQGQNLDAGTKKSGTVTNTPPNPE